MKTKKKLTQLSFSFKNTLLRIFLLFSIVSSFILVNNCKDGNGITNLDEIPIRPPQFGGDESTSILTSLFNSAADGAAGDVGGAAAGWVMGALGLSDGSPDYTEQLDKIDQDLQIVISELSTIEMELTEIYNELLVINCSDWANSLGEQKSRIDGLFSNYSTYVNTASAGGRVDSATIADWVDQVLAEGSYTSHQPMDEVLLQLADQLYVPINSGIIPSCVQLIPLPDDNSLGTDTTYYNQVKLYLNYYFGYQIRGLLLLNEAYHYKAWISAGSPISDSLSADSIAYVCEDLNAKVNCNLAVTAVNNLYNNLYIQLTAGGAPYTSDNFLFHYNKSSDSYLWPLSLENFTIAAGDNCADPLTSAKPCGITADFHNGTSMESVVFKGFSGWVTAGTTLLIDILSGWSSGTAGNYLENSLGFHNMKNKIVISSDTVKLTLNETGPDPLDYVPFFDTDWGYNFLPDGGGPARKEIDFQEGVLVKGRKEGSLCRGLVYYYYTISYSMNSKVPANRNNFYNAHASGTYCQPLSDGDWTTWFSFSTKPGYLAQQDGVDNTNTSAKQFRWPVLSVSKVTCTENRSNKNPGGMWTMCGDNFTAWFDYYVPRPETCDNPGAGVTCTLTSGTIAKAKSVVGNNNKFNNLF
jgi:hypothetical protein